MAAGRSHRYLGGTETLTSSPASADEFELDEAEIWNANDIIVLPETKQVYNHHPRPARKPLKKSDRQPGGPKSLPVNIPEWSKILGGEYKRRAAEEEDDGDDDDGNDRIPPHEYLARNRGASLSVHEGVGRPLKGRDLSRVRNAIWKQIGFED